MRSDLSLLSFLSQLNRQQDLMDNNSPDNTLIQFFESPQEPTTLTASVSAVTTNPANLTWGGVVGGTTYSAGWYWGYGGKWS